MKKGFVLAVFTALLVFASPASAAHVQPVSISGNPSCEGGTKIEPVNSGTYTVPGGAVTLTVNGKSFDFTSTVTVFQVIVKGGPAANLYDYAALGGVTADTGLVAPNGKGLSHLCFFADDKAPPPPPK